MCTFTKRCTPPPKKFALFWGILLPFSFQYDIIDTIIIIFAPAIIIIKIVKREKLQLKHTLIYIESLTLSILLLLTLLFLNLKSGRPRHFKFIFAIYLLTILSAFLDIVWILIDGNSKLLFIAYPLHCIYLSSFISIATVWFLHCEKFLPFKWIKKTLFKVLFYLPLAVVVTLIFTSPFTDLIFYIDSNAVYNRGILYPILSISYVYLLFVSVISDIAAKKSQLTTHKTLFRSFALFSLPPILLGIFAVIAPPGGLPTMQFSIAFSLLLIFLQLQNARISHDSLTSLPNRFSLDQQLNDKIFRYKKDDKPLFVLMGDIDNFKNINDTFGHMFGDEILKGVGSVIDSIAKKHNSLAYRMGGDEFVVVLHDNIDVVNSVIEEIKFSITQMHNSKNYQTSMSIGIAQYKEGMSIIQILDMADKSLYQQKNLLDK